MRLSAIVAIVSLLLPSLLHAQVRPEQAIEYRQAVYQVILWNFQPLGAMVRERMPFDRASFRRHALRVSNLSGHLLEGFPAGSDSGAETAALPALWSNRADFEAKMKDFQREARLLASMSRSAEFGALQQQFGQVSGTCKACHDEYKAD